MFEIRLHLLSSDLKLLVETIINGNNQRKILICRDLQALLLVEAQFQQPLQKLLYLIMEQEWHQTLRRLVAKCKNRWLEALAQAVKITKEIMISLGLFQKAAKESHKPSLNSVILME